MTEVSDIEMREVCKRYQQEATNLRADNTRLWAQLEFAQQISNEAGLIGMVGSPAWVAQIRRLGKIKAAADN